MTVTNPYRERAMIPIESDMFFGREKEMQRIEEMLSGDRPQCVSIVGESLIGKSSLANRVFHKIKEDENTRAVYIDCDTLEEECQSKDRFFHWLNQGFCVAEKERFFLICPLFCPHYCYFPYFKNNLLFIKKRI